MLNKHRRVNKNKILKNSEEKKEVIDGYNLEIANLRIEKEKMERDNIDLSQSLTDKRKRLDIDHKAITIVEDEHLENVEKLEKKRSDLLFENTEKEEKLKELKKYVKVIEFAKKELEDFIIGLKEKKEKSILELNIVIKKNNKEIAGNNVYLSEVRLKSEKINKGFIEVSNKLEIAEKELKETVEKNSIENKTLAIRKNDLEIYENRLRNKYHNETINVCH